MKKLLCALLLVSSLVGCSKKEEPTPTSTSEVVIENNVEVAATKADMSGYSRLTDADHRFITIEFEDLLRIFEEKGTAIIYFGRVNCPFCQRAVPVINEVAKELNIDVYSVNVDNAVFTMDMYYAIEPYIEKTFVESQGQKNFLIPELVSVKDGEVQQWHISLVEDFVLDSDDKEMNDEQVAHLKEIYRNVIMAAGN